jgi:hypothetical protein
MVPASIGCVLISQCLPFESGISPKDWYVKGLVLRIPLGDNGNFKRLGPVGGLRPLGECLQWGPWDLS